MTAVVLARTYSDAYDAAMLLGLGQSWVYPHDPVLLNGLAVSRVVYVEGWLHGHLPVESMQMLRARTTEATPVTTLDLAVQPLLSAQVPLSAPSGAPGVQEYRTEPAARHAARRSRWRPWMTLVAGALGGALGSQIGYWTGWW